MESPPFYVKWYNRIKATFKNILKPSYGGTVMEWYIALIIISVILFLVYSFVAVLNDDS